MDFVKIHVLALEQYDAVIMYDSEVESIACAVTVLTVL